MLARNGRRYPGEVNKKINSLMNVKRALERFGTEVTPWEPNFMRTLVEPQMIPTARSQYHMIEDEIECLC